MLLNKTAAFRMNEVFTDLATGFLRICKHFELFDNINYVETHMGGALQTGSPPSHQ